MSSGGIYISIYLISFEDLYWYPAIWGSSDHVFPVLICANFVAFLIGITIRLYFSVIDIKREGVAVNWSIKEINPRPVRIELRF